MLRLMFEPIFVLNGGSRFDLDMGRISAPEFHIGIPKGKLNVINAPNNHGLVTMRAIVQLPTILMPKRPIITTRIPGSQLHNYQKYSIEDYPFIQ